MNICVKSSAQIGDIETSPQVGNKMKILSLSGSSSRCKEPTPILADVEFTFSFKSKAGIELGDDWEPVTLQDLQKYNGYLLQAKSKTSSSFLNINLYAKNPSLDLGTMANNIIANLGNVVDDLSPGDRKELRIKGLSAVQWRATYATKQFFSRKYTALYTIIEGKNEYLVLSVTIKSSDFDRYKEELENIPLKITGLDVDESPQPSLETKKLNPTSSLEDYKKTCADLGFKAGTEPFGNCVLKLSK
jgi:hypothetical protein